MKGWRLSGHYVGVTRRILAVSAWICLACVVALTALVRWAGDRWWVATLLELGPRWVVIVPILVLLPLAFVFRRRSVWVPVVALVAAAGPFMGFHANPHGTTPAKSNFGGIRIMTCNGHSVALNRRELSILLTSADCDAIVLQEWPFGSAKARCVEAEWFALTEGELHVESRYPLRLISKILRTEGVGGGNAMCFELAMPNGTVRVIDLHLSSPHDALSATVHGRRGGCADITANSTQRRAQAAVISNFVAASEVPIIVVGDFNMPADSTIFANAFGGLSDAFSTAGNGFGWTYFWRGTAVRIDHVIFNAGWRCLRCWVGPSVGSPHRPVIADLRREG